MQKLYLPKNSWAIPVSCILGIVLVAVMNVYVLNFSSIILYFCIQIQSEDSLSNYIDIFYDNIAKNVNYFTIINTVSWINFYQLHCIWRRLVYKI